MQKLCVISIWWKLRAHVSLGVCGCLHVCGRELIGHKEGQSCWGSFSSL